MGALVRGNRLKFFLGYQSGLSSFRTHHRLANQLLPLTNNPTVPAGQSSKPTTLPLSFPFFIVHRSKMDVAAGLSFKKVKIPTQNPIGELDGVIIGDAKVPSSRGLIVIHEWWGMNEQIQKEACEIAKDGKLTVFVPDLYRGKVAIDNEEASHYMGNLDWKGAVQDISASAQYLKSNGCGKVGVTGFCMGGALAFASAVLCSDVSAAAPFYGIPGKELADLTKIKIPVQGHYGEKDDLIGFSSPADFNPLRDKLIAAGVPFEMFTYPTGHAFTNPSNPNYSPEIAKLALSRVYEFMGKHLG